MTLSRNDAYSKYFKGLMVDTLDRRAVFLAIYERHLATQEQEFDRIDDDNKNDRSPRGSDDSLTSRDQENLHNFWHEDINRVYIAALSHQNRIQNNPRKRWLSNDEEHNDEERRKRRRLESPEGHVLQPEGIKLRFDVRRLSKNPWYCPHLPHTAIDRIRFYQQVRDSVRARRDWERWEIDFEYSPHEKAIQIDRGTDYRFDDQASKRKSLGRGTEQPKNGDLSLLQTERKNPRLDTKEFAAHPQKAALDLVEQIILFGIKTGRVTDERIYAGEWVQIKKIRKYLRGRRATGKQYTNIWPRGATVKHHSAQKNTIWLKWNTQVSAFRSIIYKAINGRYDEAPNLKQPPKIGRHQGRSPLEHAPERRLLDLRGKDMTRLKAMERYPLGGGWPTRGDLDSLIEEHEIPYQCDDWQDPISIGVDQSWYETFDPSASGQEQIDYRRRAKLYPLSRQLPPLWTMPQSLEDYGNGIIFKHEENDGETGDSDAHNGSVPDPGRDTPMPSSGFDPDDEDDVEEETMMEMEQHRDMPSRPGTPNPNSDLQSYLPSPSQEKGDESEAGEDENLRPGRRSSIGNMNGIVLNHPRSSHRPASEPSLGYIRTDDDKTGDRGMVYGSQTENPGNDERPQATDRSQGPAPRRKPHPLSIQWDVSPPPSPSSPPQASSSSRSSPSASLAPPRNPLAPSPSPPRPLATQEEDYTAFLTRADPRRLVSRCSARDLERQPLRRSDTIAATAMRLHRARRVVAAPWFQERDRYLRHRIIREGANGTWTVRALEVLWGFREKGVRF